MTPIQNGECTTVSLVVHWPLQTTMPNVSRRSLGCNIMLLWNIATKLWSLNMIYCIVYSLGKVRALLCPNFVQELVEDNCGNTSGVFVSLRYRLPCNTIKYFFKYFNLIWLWGGDKTSIFDAFITHKYTNWIEIFEKLLDSILRHVYIFNSQEYRWCYPNCLWLVLEQNRALILPTLCVICSRTII